MTTQTRQLRAYCALQDGILYAHMHSQLESVSVRVQLALSNTIPVLEKARVLLVPLGVLTRTRIPKHSVWTALPVHTRTTLLLCSASHVKAARSRIKVPETAQPARLAG